CLSRGGRERRRSWLEPHVRRHREREAEIYSLATYAILGLALMRAIGRRWRDLGGVFPGHVSHAAAACDVPARDMATMLHRCEGAGACGDLVGAGWIIDPRRDLGAVARAEPVRSIRTDIDPRRHDNRGVLERNRIAFTGAEVRIVVVEEAWTERVRE